MQKLCYITAPKKSTNVTINCDLLAKSRALNVNLSATVESASSQILASSELGRVAVSHGQP
ncbi:MAG: type II toxin-antitoxin system CcdA family antitoxin [Salinisphaera sp.]|jgi:antitoxin CcdA|nr:type II toxin-antitoxin system CcdA family antitoxin [Salinisphaera sp.]